MKMLGKSRALALVAGLGLTLVAYAGPADAQGAPATKPADKPASPASPAAATGAAAPKPGDAKALYASGEKKFKADDVAGALADFEASNSAKAAPETQRYIALSHDKLQHYSEAVTAYEKFIAENPSKMKSEVDEAQKRVDAIKAMPAKVHIVTTPPGASIVVDQSQAPEPSTTPTDVELKAGKHTIIIGAEGYENVSKEVDVTYGAKQDLTVELAKKEAPPVAPPVVADKPTTPPAAPPPPAEPRSKIPAFVTGGVAIVAAGIGTAFGIKALSQSSDFKDAPTTKRADDGENNALVADMMFGIAITFGVTSAVLFLSSDSPNTAKAAGGPKTASAPPPKKNSVTVIPAPYVTPNGGGAGALVRF